VSLRNGRLWLTSIWLVATMILAVYVMLQIRGQIFEGPEALDWLRGAVWPVVGLVLTIGLIDVVAPPTSTKSVSRLFFVLTCGVTVFYFIILFGITVVAGNESGASTLDTYRPWVEWLAALPTALVGIFFVRGETSGAG